MATPSNRPSEARLAAPRRPIGLLSPRLAFLSSLTLALLYALVDLAQRIVPGPDTAFSRFYELPWTALLLALPGIFLAVWVLWFVAMRASGASTYSAHPLIQVSDVGPARPVLRAYLAVVLALLGVVALAHRLDQGALIQAILLLFTYTYVLVASRSGRPQ
jgi:hypothetical protein